MRSLFLDLASHDGLLACIADDAVLVSAAVDHRMGDHELVPAVETLLKEAGWTYRDPTGVACVVGPGGFTSLRVSVAFANTLVWTLKIPSTGIHLSDVYAARFAGADRDRRLPDIMWLHSTKKTELFVRGFGSFAEIFPEAVCIKLEELKKLPSDLSWMGELIPEHRALMTGKEIHLQSTVDVLPTFLKALHFEQQTLEPWYGRGW